MSVGEGLVQARGLRKRFGTFEAVRGIDVEVARGEVFGFLGPNGAGKSSTMRMIACVSPRSGGSLTVLGREPTTGLDPQARHLLWERLYRLKREGVTQIITTHYMDEAEQLCDRLVVMDAGVIVAEGSPAELIARHSTREVLELRFAPEERPDPAKLEHLAERVEELPDRLLVYAGDGEHVHAQVLEAGLRPLSALVRRSTLEDVFLRLTGRSLNE